MEKQTPPIQLMDEIITKHNFIDVMKNTYGLAILTNGSFVKILNNFEGICETWKLFNEAMAMDDVEAQQRILLENTRGGIIDTGTTVIDIQTIATMYPLYRMTHDNEEVKKINKFKMNEIDNFIYWDQTMGETEDE